MWGLGSECPYKRKRKAAKWQSTSKKASYSNGLGGSQSAGGWGHWVFSLSPDLATQYFSPSIKHLFRYSPGVFIQFLVLRRKEIWNFFFKEACNNFSRSLSSRDWGTSVAAVIKIPLAFHQLWCVSGLLGQLFLGDWTLGSNTLFTNGIHSIQRESHIMTDSEL